MVALLALTVSNACSRLTGAIRKYKSERPDYRGDDEGCSHDGGKRRIDPQNVPKRNSIQSKNQN